MTHEELVDLVLEETRLAVGVNVLNDNVKRQIRNSVLNKDKEKVTHTAADQNKQSEESREKLDQKKASLLEGVPKEGLLKTQKDAFEGEGGGSVDNTPENPTGASRTGTTTTTSVNTRASSNPVNPANTSNLYNPSK